MGKYVKALTSEELLERMADELARMHDETAIDLAYWETGMEIVSRFYELRAVVTVSKKKEKK
jgi:endonuclease IV